MCEYAAGGFIIGIGLGFITKWLLSLLRSRGAKPPEEMALTVAMAYLAFYLANAPGNLTPLLPTCTLMSHGVHLDVTWHASGHHMACSAQAMELPSGSHVIVT